MIKRITERHAVDDWLILNYEIDIIDGEKLDTEVTLEVEGSFFVSGSQRIEFKEKLKKLIDEYRI